MNTCYPLNEKEKTQRQFGGLPLKVAGSTWKPKEGQSTRHSRVGGIPAKTAGCTEPGDCNGRQKLNCNKPKSIIKLGYMNCTSYC